MMNLKISFNLEKSFAEFCKGEMKYYFEKIFYINIKENEIDADIVLQVIPDLGVKKNDLIQINLSGGKGKIKSNTQVGLLIGIYRFFSEFGVRYLRPGRENEYIVKGNTEDFLNKKINISEEASFKHRGICIEGADSFENVKSFIDWLPKIGLNSFFVQFENPYIFFKRWYDHELNPYLKKDEFNADISQKMSDLIDEEIFKRGIVHHRVGHGWIGEVLGYSSKYGWESGLTLPEDKKSLVAELNGKREFVGTAPIFTSLDFSNPEVISNMVRVIVDYAKKRKDVDYLHVWLSDARNNICECEKCQKELPSDQYVRLLNELDEALNKEGIDTKICFLLYHELLFAPCKKKINNPDRFTMMFAPITRTFEKSYADVDYEQGIPAAKKYQRNKIVLPNSLEENLSYLFSWKKVFSGDSFVYDYPLGCAHYGDLGYIKISKTIYRDIKFLDKLGLNGYISCQELRAGFPHNFPNYVMGKMLWNNELSYSDLKEEYFMAMYGEEWHGVYNYLESLSENSSCDYFNGIGDRINTELSIKYKISNNLANEFLSEIVKNTPVVSGLQKEQWRQLCFHREYVCKLSKALQMLCEGNNSLGQNQWMDLLDFIRRNELYIQNKLDVYRLIEVGKNYAGFTL